MISVMAQRRDRLVSNLQMGPGPMQRPMTCSKADKRTFHQGPRVDTLNFEAGYMLAVFPKRRYRNKCLQKGRVHICPLIPFG